MFFRLIRLRPLALCLLALVAVAPAQAQTQETEKRHCFGRFCLTLPADFARLADEHVVHEVSVDEKRWHNPLNRERAREFDMRVKAAEALSAHRASAASPAGTILQRQSLQEGSLPAMPAIYFHRTDNPFAATWGALLTRGPMDIWLQADADVLAPRDALPRLYEVAQAYRVAELNAAAMREAGLYHLRFGALAIAPLAASAETSNVSFALAAQKTSLQISTATVAEGKAKNLLERAGKTLPAIGRDVTLIRGQTRFAGGMVGDELVTRGNLPGADGLSFTWSYEGDARNPKKPRTIIRMASPGDDLAGRMEVWNKLLASLQPAN